MFLFQMDAEVDKVFFLFKIILIHPVQLSIQLGLTVEPGTNQFKWTWPDLGCILIN